MIGVAQYKGSIDAFEVLRRQRFDRCLRTDRGEDRRDQVPVRRGEDPCAGTVIPGSDVELEHGADYTYNIKSRMLINTENADLALSAKISVHLRPD